MRPTDGGEPYGSDRQPDKVTTSAEPDGPHAGHCSAAAPSEGETDTRSQAQAKTEAAKTKLTASGRARDRPYYFKRSKATQWLLAVFIFTLAGAFLLYPRRTVVYRPLPLNVTVTLVKVKAVSSATIKVFPVSAYSSAMTFRFTFSETKPTPKSWPPWATVSMTFPIGVAESCTHVGNVFVPGECFNHDNGSFVSIKVDATPLPSVGRNVWAAFFGLTIKNQGLPWNANGLTAEAQFPLLEFQRYQRPNSFPKPLPFNDDPRVGVFYGVPDARSYDWGPPPNSISRTAGAKWDEPLKSLFAPIAVSGTNDSAANLDSLRTLIAGVLLGVAGGALVGAIQEFTHRKEETLSVQISTSRPS